MEILVILTVVSIFGYVFYQTSPYRKFKKANLLFDSGDFFEANKILESIFYTHADAPVKLAESKLKYGKQVRTINENDALKYFYEVIEIKNRLPSNASNTTFDWLEANSQLEIASIIFNTATAVTNVKDKIKILIDNLRFISNANTSGIENEFLQLRERHSFELAEIYFQLGLQWEKLDKITEAIKDYSTAIEFSSESSHSKIAYNSNVRIGICKLKANQKDIVFDSFAEFYKADQKYAHDFFYRYAIFLVEIESYTEAEEILKKHLNFPNHAIDKLSEVLNNKRIRQAVEKVEEINRAVDNLYIKSFPVDEVKLLYENIDVRINEINAIMPDISDKLQLIKTTLFNRLLLHYISAEQYGNGINLIQKFPSFWAIPELLKNLGICCYGYIAKGNLNYRNFPIIISNWLTAIYSDKVILKSLEATTWDDKYTFTLVDAIGSKFIKYNDLPENANYEDVTDTNISIGAVQRELLQQFESLLHEAISDPLLSKVVHDFYTEEKESIEKIVSVINGDLLFAAPHFAKSYGINDEIIKELDRVYVEFSSEEVLGAGIPYLNYNSGTYVSEYAMAREAVSKMVSAIGNENLTELKSVATDNMRAIIDKYETINSLLIDSVFNSFTLKINENEENENLIPIMIVCINFLRFPEKLRYQFSHFVSNLCVKKVNNGSLDNYNALNYLKEALKASTNNRRVADDISILIKFNLLDIIYSRRTSKIEKKMNETILELENDDLDIRVLFSSLKVRRSIHYFGNSISSGDQDIFDLIKDIKIMNNPLVKLACKSLKNDLEFIKEQLGNDTLTLLNNGIDLNSKGLALKEALSVLADLSK